MQDLIIRNATPKDIDGMLALLEQLFAIEADFNFDKPTQSRGLALMMDGCGKHRAVKVACQGDRILGMCTVQTRISTAHGGICAVVEDLVVDKNARGYGLGTRLLDAVEQWARDKGIASLSLLADSQNHSGVKFYQTHAWQKTRLICLVKPM